MNGSGKKEIFKEIFNETVSCVIRYADITQTLAVL